MTAELHLPYTATTLYSTRLFVCMYRRPWSTLHRGELRPLAQTEVTPADTTDTLTLLSTPYYGSVEVGDWTVFTLGLYQKGF